MADVSVLDVLLYEESIGTLTRVGGDRILFAFNESYIKSTDRPTLSLGFKDHLGGLITDFKPTQTRVLPFFSNLLPEGHMRTYLAERAGVNPVREFFLLWVLGRDLAGAVTIRPADGESWPPDADEDNVDGDSKRDPKETALRFSLAGVQLKFSAVNEASGGLTIPAKGVGGSWIIKLPSREYEGVPENEYSMMKLAELAGIDIPLVELIDIDNIKNIPEGVSGVKGQALAIKRFDRQEGNAVHIEDFAQVFSVYPDRKYQRASYKNIARVLASESGDADIAEFIRRLTFNALIGNADMHLKNWSLIYPDRRYPILAPAYDFVSTIVYIPDGRMALNVSRSKRFDEFDDDELSHLSAKAMLPEKTVLDAAHETAELFRNNWESEKNNLPLRKDHIKAIEKHMKTVPIG